MATTPNYNFFLPEESDLMSDVKKNVTDTFKTIEPRNDITVIPAGGNLPQTGDYELGDRAYRDGDSLTAVTWPSNYLLICKDETWGWHWRPIQQLIAPWVTLPVTIINHPDFEIHPNYPLQITMDSRGWCHWRGRVRSKVAGITAGTTISIFKNIPSGIRPNVRFYHTCALGPVTGSATGIAGNISSRLSMSEDGSSSFQFFNSNNGVTQDVCLDNLKYNNSAHWYYNG